MTERKQLDLLRGVHAIAEYLGQEEKPTGHEIRKGCWPVFRLKGKDGKPGKIIYARKSELDAHASANAEQHEI